MLEVRQQVHLSGKRLLEICLDSISYRLLRSMVTVCIILLAIAFLAVIMVEGYLGRAVRDTVKVRTARLTAYTRFLSKASRVDSDERLVARFAALKPDTADYKNFVAWGGFTEEQAQDAIATFVKVQTYLKFFDDMPVGKRRLLVGRFTGVEIFDNLTVPENMDVFNVRIANLKTLQVPGGLEPFQTFVKGWPERRAELVRIKEQYSETVAAVAEYCGQAGVSGRLKEAVHKKETPAFFAALAERGMRVPEDQYDPITEGIDYYDNQDWAQEQLKRAPVRTGWNRKWQEPFSPGDALLSCSQSTDYIEWVEETLVADEKDERARLEAYAAAAAKRRELLDAKAVAEGIAFVDMDWALAQITKAPVRAAWNRKWSNKFVAGEALSVLCKDLDRLDWLAKELRDAEMAEGYDRARMEAFLKAFAERKELSGDEKAILTWYEDRDWATKFVSREPVREGWEAQWGAAFKDEEALRACSESEDKLAWVLTTVNEAEGFQRERFETFCGEFARRKQLLDDEKALIERYGQTQDLGEKTIWLISVSFLVCVVGIANAMLMSVLERFKEIATMKCLGARNETIAFLFVTESIIIGMVGGVVGILLGYIIVFARLSLHYKGLVYENLPGSDLMLAFVICFCCSLLLAAVAAIYPAWVASRMAPMEAMRVD